MTHPYERYREALDALVQGHPEQVEKTFSKPTLVGWFVGQIINRCGGGTGHKEYLFDLVQKRIQTEEVATRSRRTVSFKIGMGEVASDYHELAHHRLSSGLPIHSIVGMIDYKKLMYGLIDARAEHVVRTTCPDMDFVILNVTRSDTHGMEFVAEACFQSRDDAMLFKLTYGGEA